MPTPLKGDQWSTPVSLIEAAIEVMGGIDVDPATNEFARTRIPAGISYTIEDDGLKKEWMGRVWLNPPYSRGLMRLFIGKLLREVEVGNVREAVILTHNNTDTGWWHDLVGVCSSVCFTRGRICFERPDGVGMNPTQGQCVFYIGGDQDKFREVFGRFGYVLKI